MCRQRLRRRFRELGIVVHENFGAVEFFEKIPTGVRMIFSRNGNRASAEATLAVLAVGWVADIEGLRLASAGVETDHRGFVQVDRVSADFYAQYLRRWGHHWSPDAGPSGNTGGLRGGYQRRARPDYDDWGPGEVRSAASPTRSMLRSVSLKQRPEKHTMS